MAESWQSLSTPTFSIGRMVLLTDGSIMACTYAGSDPRTRAWHRLIPGGRGGDYGNGTWVPVRSMSRRRHAYLLSAVVLKSAKLLVWGGPALTVLEDFLPEIYDPFTDSWTDAGADVNPGAVSAFGASCVLADGKVLLGSDDHFNSGGRGWAILFDPDSGRWAEMPNGDETVLGRCFTLLPDGSVLKTPRQVQRYVPADGRWRFAVESPLPTAGTAGPAILLPDRRVWVLAPRPSGNGPTPTYFYHPPSDSHPDRWEEAARLPGELYLSAPPVHNNACLLSSGRVLLVLGNVLTPSGRPNQVYEFDPAAQTETPAGKFRVVANPLTDPFDFGYMLMLPTGQVLINGKSGLYIYTPDPDEPGNNPNDEWRPRIESINRTSTFPVILRVGSTNSLEGYQLNGLSQAHSAAECGMATNYPLIRLTYDSGRVVYLPTLNHSAMGVATGSDVRQSTTFEVPTHAPSGFATLCVITNGIESQRCVDVVIERGDIKAPERAAGNILVGNLADGEYIIVGPGGVRPGPKPWESLIDPNLLKSVEESTRALFHQFHALKRESQVYSSKSEVKISHSWVLRILLRFIGRVFFRR